MKPIQWPQIKLFLSAITGFSLAFCFENSYSTFKANFTFIFYKEDLQLAKLFQSSPTPCNHMDYSTPSSSVHGDSPGKNMGVGCHTLLLAISPIQGLSPHLLHLLHWQADFLPPTPPGKNLPTVYQRWLYRWFSTIL